MTPNHTSLIDTDRQAPFAALADARTVLLTTFRRDGTPVATPVHIVVDGDVAVFRTFDPSGKLTRIRRNPDVEVAPCTTRGRVVGPTVRARARVLEGVESDAAARSMARKYPIAHRFLIPWFHRLRGLRTTHLELTPR
jgi:uncharacterized protein